MRVWKQPFFDDGICQLAVYKFSNASDYQVQQTQNLLLLAQLRNSTFVEIDAETGWLPGWGYQISFGAGVGGVGR